MPKRTLWASLAGAVLLFAMVLSACGPTATSTGGNGGPKAGGNIIDGVQEEASSVMPGQSTETFADLVDAAIWAPLFYSDNKFGTDPGLATSVPTVANGGIVVSGSGATATESITIKLRSGLKWSDGQPLNSADVVYTMNLLGNSGYADKQGWGSFVKTEVTSITAPDANTVVVALGKIDVAAIPTYMVDELAFSPLPQHTFGSMTPAQVAATFTPSVTSGPFKVSDHVKGDHLTVVRNTNYFQAPKPYLDQVTFKFFPDANTEVTALQGGQITTAYFLPVTSASTLQSIPGYTLFKPTLSPNYEAWYFNLTNPILADAKVRQALAMSFDPNQEITTIEHGFAVPTCDDSTGTFAHESSIILSGGLCPYGGNSSFKVDATGAGTLLDGDGWTMGSDGYRHKGGQTLELRISTTAGRQYRLDSEQLAQATWKTIGVKIDVVNHPASDLFGPVLFPSDAKYAKSNNQWDIAEFENSIGVDPDSHTIWDSDQVPSNGGSNLTYYNNPQVDQLEAQQLTQLDQTQRNATFHQIHVAILNDIPTFYLYSPLDLSEYKNTLHNYLPDSIGPSETWNIQDWYLS
jgi:peptide/nickel transport system substrate-binding protein